MSALDKVLALSRPGEPAEEDPNADLVLALSSALAGVRLYLASSDSDDDGDDDGDADDIENSATYKALIKKGVAPKLARAMALKAAKKVEATALAESACVILAGLVEGESGGSAEPPTYLGRMVALAAPPGESASERRASAKAGNALPDGSYPIPDKKHLHSAAVLAASKHGNWKAAQSLIRRRARELGVELSSLPGFGGEKVAAAMVELGASYVELAAGKMSSTPAQAHDPFHGVHSHAHVHSGDNMHGPASDRMPRLPGY